MRDHGGRDTVRCMRGLRFLPILASSILAACGGGGSSAGAPSPVTPASTTLNEASCYYQYTAAEPLAPASGADPRFALQWHLLNTGQGGGTPGEDLRVSTAWADNRGERARIAIVDDAVELVHEDLAPNVVAGASFNYRTARYGNSLPLPCAQGERHGTEVAGVVVARDGNAVGVAGVAPRAPYVAYNALSTGLDADIADALGRDLGVNAIYQNSWGAPDNGALNHSDSLFTAAIERGRTQGRGGKGTVYVFPSGNGGARADDSNYDGYVNRHGITTVCAVDDNGRRPAFSEMGANVLLCGYSRATSTGSIETTAVGNGYTSGFSGTSASTPMVAGVAALVLSVDPGLSARDVNLILAQSARRNDPGDPGWSDAYGLHYNRKYGFGVVDAQAAVALARTWQTVGGAAELVRCEAPLTPVDAPVPESLFGAPGTALESSADLGGCRIGRIEFAEIDFRATGGNAGDLRIELESPNGQVSTLATERVCGSASLSRPKGDCGTYGDPANAADHWRFGSVRHLNEPASGLWRLRVRDAYQNDVSTVVSWRLTLWGRP